MKEYRKVTEQQGSFLVRIPLAWAKKNGIKGGSYVSMKESDTGNLIIEVVKDGPE